MNKLNAVIFDLDGVICFTDKYHFQAWKKLADEEGIYFDEEINDRLRGVSRMDSLDIILERAFREYTQEEKTQMAARKNESYVHLLDQMSPADLSVEVKDTLDELRNCRIFKCCKKYDNKRRPVKFRFDQHYVYCVPAYVHRFLYKPVYK